MSFISETKKKFTEDFEKKADIKTIKRMEEMERIRKQNEKRQIRADIKAGLKAEKQKGTALRFAGTKDFLGKAVKELKELKEKKAKTGVLFGEGKKKESKSRFENKGVFFDK